MAQWIRTYATIVEVLKHGGSIRIDDLEKKLIEIEPMKFQGDKIVEYIVDDLTACLVIDGNKVVYDPAAKKYAQLGLFERSIQKALHDFFPEMEKWQLYPYVK